MDFDDDQDIMRIPYNSIAPTLSSIFFTDCTNTNRFVSSASSKLRKLKKLVFSSDLASGAETESFHDLLEQAEGLQTICFATCEQHLPSTEHSALPKWLEKHSSTVVELKYRFLLDDLGVVLASCKHLTHLSIIIEEIQEPFARGKV